MDKLGNKPKIFQDIRHAKRLRKTLLLLSEHPGETVPKASGNANKSQSIYRFWSNEKVKKTQILASHREGVVRRSVEAGVVLAIQDTTDLEYTTHEATKGLGYINQTSQQGIKVHSCIAVSSTGEPLGLLHQQSWTRKDRSGKKKERKKKPIQEKESYRWLKTVKGAEEGLAEKVKLIHVADREADIFELFAQKRCGNSELLIRATYNIIAWRLMWLTYQARLNPDASCQVVFSPQEWKLLRRKFQPKNRSKKSPTLHQALIWIARLGGFLARSGDGEPGLKTLWRGLSTFYHLLEGSQLVSTS